MADKKRDRKDYNHKLYIENIDKYKEIHREYYVNNKKVIIEKQKEWHIKNKKKNLSRSKKYTEKLRKQILDHYGWKCNCEHCPETNTMFLTVDHINNDGYKDKMKSGHRYTGQNLYRKIIKENFPDTYQILCWNCNSGKRSNNNICPHNNIKL